MLSFFFILVSCWKAKYSIMPFALPQAIAISCKLCNYKLPHRSLKDYSGLKTQTLSFCIFLFKVICFFFFIFVYRMFVKVPKTVRARQIQIVLVMTNQHKLYQFQQLAHYNLKKSITKRRVKRALKFRPL